MVINPNAPQNFNKSLRDWDQNLTEQKVLDLGGASYRSCQLLHWAYKVGVLDWSEIENLPSNLINQLKSIASCSSLGFISKHISGEDHSGKYLFRTQNGDIIESVLIIKGNRRTLCISTQVGCKMGCRFCASGLDGFRRNLSTAEILDQITWTKRISGQLPTNLVYMGMGEPLENFEAVIASIKTASAAWGFGISQRRISVSTVGWVPGIKQLMLEDLKQIKLCFSLHSPDNEIRSKLIPVNKKYPLEEIKKVLKEASTVFKRSLTLEYILIADLTDREADIWGVAAIAKELRAKVNLIPNNPIPESEYKRPSEEKIQNFARKLRQMDVSVTVRYSAGQEVDAACGQLRLNVERNPQAIR